MDWAPAVDPCITKRDLGGFYYDKKQSHGSNVPTVVRSQGNKFEIVPLDSQEAWDTWFQSDIFNDGHMKSSHPPRDLSGFQVLVSPHIEPVAHSGFSGFHAQGNPGPLLGGDLSDDESGPKPLPQTHSNLPFSKPNWAKVAKAFMISKAILHPIRRNKCQSTFVACNHGAADLELHTAVAAPYNRPGSFSLSCTYFAAPKLTLAVFYSCDSTQLQRIIKLLRGSPEVASHPLLMVGVFAELQLNRMEASISRVHQLCDYNKRVFDVNWGSNMAILIKNLNRRLRRGEVKAKEAEEEMRAVRAQVKEMADRVDNQETAWTAFAPPAGAAGPSGNTAAISNRFKGRFKEIDNEIEGLMAQCRAAAEGQTYLANLFMSEIQRKEAGASRRQGVQSKFLAMIATIFLPMTSVATIFAVPAFKFENDWRDVRFQPVNGSDSDGGSSSSSPSDPPNPVFSGYGIIFIVVSVCLTCLTYYSYLSAKKRLEEDDELGLIGPGPGQQQVSPAAGKQPGTTAGLQGKESGGSSSSSSSFARLWGLEAGLRFINPLRARSWFRGRGGNGGQNNNPGGSPV
ncbi:uncharacterized protein B0H64DRAFT_402490 [Chaetomium fimeti]|uniref:Uncharacterized protein n=1 Tax=Chaetomium fimeti TaxID=1854472 RepID=A0AAE0HEN4_9PEZI|nr:hypothetical protein B0H64DRAFT_402490 [Chaetomium fimeti]